jgi:hypothetical protein
MCHAKNISIKKTINGLTRTICKPMHQTLGVKIYVTHFQPHNVCKMRPNIFLSTMPPKCQKLYNTSYSMFTWQHYNFGFLHGHHKSICHIMSKIVDMSHSRQGFWTIAHQTWRTSNALSIFFRAPSCIWAKC